MPAPALHRCNLCAMQVVTPGPVDTYRIGMPPRPHPFRVRAAWSRTLLLVADSESPISTPCTMPGPVGGATRRPIMYNLAVVESYGGGLYNCHRSRFSEQRPLPALAGQGFFVSGGWPDPMVFTTCFRLVAITMKGVSLHAEKTVS